jgi:hypothetical protein
MSFGFLEFRLSAEFSLSLKISALFHFLNYFLLQTLNLSFLFVGMGQKQSSLNGNVTDPLVALKCASSPADLPLWALAVLEHSTWESRGRVSQLSKYWHKGTTTVHYYRFLAFRLADENGLYVPHHLPVNETWKTLFLELFKLRNLWQPPSVSGHPSAANLQITATNEFKERFQISVFAKFRPIQEKTTTAPYASKLKQLPENKKKTLHHHSDTHSSSATSPTKSTSSPSKSSSTSDEKFQDDQNENENHQIRLPLHQKLAMIRMNHRIKNNRAALKMLAEEGQWFREKWTEISNLDSSSADSNSDGREIGGAFTAKFEKYEKHPNWKTFQLNLSCGKKEEEKMISKIQSIDPLTGRVIMLTQDVGLREFSFNGVLPANCSQKYTYDLCMKRLVMDMLNGFNATAIVYGQTGSGKTYSMFGKDERAIFGKDKDGKGMIPRACEEILFAVQSRKEYNHIDSVLSVSYVEIYGDQITDLLKNGSRCSQAKASAQRFVLNGAAEQIVETMEDVYELLYKGEQTKRRAATAMNDRSTRAHSLFILTLKQRSFKDSNVTIRSKLFLADLGGSEQVKKSQVEAGILTENMGFQMGVHMREAVYINLGLLALKRCIEALNNRSSYVPFQDSKLTMLLSEGIGGNSKTSIIICASQSPAHSYETVMSLRFGERCALIENSLRNNASILQQILDNLDAEIKALEAEISKKERWEIREEKVSDELAEEGTIEKSMGGQEIKRVAFVVGAEEERKRLASLLMQKELLFGKSYEDIVVDSSTHSSEENLENLLANYDMGMGSGTNKRRGNKPVLSFGRKYAEIYQFGTTFDESQELALDNSRFDGSVKMEEMPGTVLEMGKKGKKFSWATGETIEESNETLEKKAKKIKRNRLAFSGLSL